MKAPGVSEEDPLTGEIIPKLTGLKRGRLINFNVERRVDGITRVSL